MRDFLVRPICESVSGAEGASLAGGRIRFCRVETLSYDHAPRRLPVENIAAEVIEPYSVARADVLGVAMDKPRIMGILNVTPDSFSDGGASAELAAAIRNGLEMADAGADFIDIGGESTRPGAEAVPPEAERERVIPVIEGLIRAGLSVPISIDTRNAATAKAAFDAGARLWNDVTALSHDPSSLETAAALGADVCLMHTRGTPQTMRSQTAYRDVVIDVFAWLEERIAACEAAGITRERIIVDPGIGFAKTAEQNVALISNLTVFQGFGLPVLLGASRKRFIGALSGVAEAAARGPGSVGAAIAGAAQGAQIFRVHDVAMTRQALDVWAVSSGFEEAE